MKKHFLIASHGKLASGIQSSLNILCGKGDDVEVIDAYVDDSDYTEKLNEFVAHVADGEQGIIFTDIFGGSVNQKAVAAVVGAHKDNVLIVSNTNLPLALTVILSAGDGPITIDDINEAIEESHPVVVPTSLPVEEDEDDFF